MGNYRLYTGDDQQSHIDELDLETNKELGARPRNTVGECLGV